ncbi:MAG: division/cell wall cluster transcriptional repressor MraZ [Lachnospiraceae bacterium]|nr:division/cell wall cluster transcriptional repressor MraZ [Lachnospiraceae bacterium]
MPKRSRIIGKQAGNDQNMLYLGRYNNSIDAKGRLVIPAKFREKLCEGGDSFVICRGLENNLYVFSREEFEEFAESLMNPEQPDPNAWQRRQFFMLGAVEVEPDKQGRILLGEDLIRFAGIEKDVVVAGNGRHIEIWSKERFPDAASFGDIGTLSAGLAEFGLKL